MESSLSYFRVVRQIRWAFVSAVEHRLAKARVEGSNPFSRSLQQCGESARNDSMKPPQLRHTMSLLLALPLLATGTSIAQPAGQRVYVTNSAGNSVSVIDAGA